MLPWIQPISPNLASVIAKSIAVIWEINLFLHRVSGEDVRQASRCFSAKSIFSTQDASLEDGQEPSPVSPVLYNVYTLLSVCTRIALSPLLK